MKHKISISSDNQQRLARMTLIDKDPDYCLFMVCLDRCRESWKTLDKAYHRLYVQNETEDVSLKVSNMIKWVKTISKKMFHVIVYVD